MTLKVKDKIEVNINAVWKPAVVKDLFTDRGTDFLLAVFPKQPLLHFKKIMLINEHTVWRYPDAPISP